MKVLRPCSLLTEYFLGNRCLWGNNNFLSASTKGHLEIVKLFLQDARFVDSTNGNQAIRSASENGHSEILK